MVDNITISFIIPTFNEEDIIINTLSQLHLYAPKVPYEVIIVDNGSSDKTIELSKHYGDKVLKLPEGHISAVRNHGVKHSNGHILVFLDADVELTQEWQNNIDKTIEDLSMSPYTITGSRCLPPENSNIINTHWFSVLANSNSTTYINSGHLITTKALFDKISGFDESLKTAEDHDFCIRAKKAGAIITPKPKLKVIHDGYPATILEFIKRERWHGREDFKTLNSIIQSKIALVTILHTLIIIISLILIAKTSTINGMFLYFLSMLVLTIALTIYKFKEIKLKSLFKTSLIHYVYLIGRTLSLIDRVTFRYSKKFR